MIGTKRQLDYLKNANNLLVPTPLKDELQLWNDVYDFIIIPSSFEGHEVFRIANKYYHSKTDTYLFESENNFYKFPSGIYPNKRQDQLRIFYKGKTIDSFKINNLIDAEISNVEQYNYIDGIDRWNHILFFVNAFGLYQRFIQWYPATCCYQAHSQFYLHLSQL